MPPTPTPTNNTTGGMTISHLLHYAPPTQQPAPSPHAFSSVEVMLVLLFFATMCILLFRWVFEGAGGVQGDIRDWPDVVEDAERREWRKEKQLEEEGRPLLQKDGEFAKGERY